MSYLRNSKLVFFAILLITALVYWPGLYGGFIFDDDINLGVLPKWHAGSVSFLDVVAGNNSGTLGRPVSMLSFIANEALTGHDPFYFKLTNLLIHLICGVLVFILSNRIFRHRTERERTLASLSLCAWWLLNPLLVSTTLYSVQRMAQLATLFSIAGMIAYYDGRVLLQSQNKRSGTLRIALCFLVFFPLSLFSKENGVLLPIYCLLIEAFFFQKNRKITGIYLPVSGIIALIGLYLISLQNPFHADYAWRNFSCTERLITQARIIASYAYQSIIPAPHNLGIYHDQIIISHGLMTPITTLTSIILIMTAIITAAVLSQKENWKPSAFGILLFLAGHALESSIIPLELYFEHRNYFPLIGIGLILANILIVATNHFKYVYIVFFYSLYIALLALTTMGQAKTWGNEGQFLIENSYKHPQSPRAQSDAAEYLQSRGDSQGAIKLLERVTTRKTDYDLIANLQILTIICRRNEMPSSQLIEQTTNSVQYFGNYYTSLSIGLDALLGFFGKHPCGKADYGNLATALVQLDKTAFRESPILRRAAWQPRFLIAEFAKTSHKNDDAINILMDIWAQESPSPMAGLMLSQLLAEKQRYTEAADVLEGLKKITSDAPPDFRESMQKLEQKIAGHDHE